MMAFTMNRCVHTAKPAASRKGQTLPHNGAASLSRDLRMTQLDIAKRAYLHILDTATSTYIWDGASMFHQEKNLKTVIHQNVNCQSGKTICKSETTNKAAELLLLPYQREYTSDIFTLRSGRLQLRQSTGRDCIGGPSPHLRAVHSKVTSLL